MDPSEEPAQSLKASNNGQISYRSPTSADLLESGAADATPPDKMLKRPPPHDLFPDKIHRYRSVLLVVSIPILLVVFVLCVMPSRSQDYGISNRKMWQSLRGTRNYAVIFDAGSSRSRVHVFCFDHNMDLVHIGRYLELFVQIKPGLSAYAKNPRAAAGSLVSLLDKAESVVPRELRSRTPVRVGATAGLRTLGGDASDRILQAVRDLLKDRSTLRSDPNGVKVLDGSQEGSYQWVTINYLLGNLGKEYSGTVGVVDLGGRSVQMAYAISEKEGTNAPRVTDGEDTYVKKMHLKGADYYLYVHSYLHYGLLGARAEMLKVSEDTFNPCILDGFDGFYKYGGQEYQASASPSGSSLEGCRRVALKALKVNESTCTHMKCTVGGIWNGGGGDGQKNLFVASFFFDRAAQAGFVDSNVSDAKVSPADFEEAAKRACETKLKDAKSTYPNVEESNLPYLCMDLVYQYTLLVDGFGLDRWQQITLVQKVQYHDALVEAAWPLGSAIEAISSLA